MVACIFIYDYLDGVGAFHKKSPIHIQDCIKTVKKIDPGNQEGLLNYFRYAHSHARPKKILKLLF
jgi:hypothetical protein